MARIWETLPDGVSPITVAIVASSLATNGSRPSRRRALWRRLCLWLGSELISLAKSGGSK